MTIRHHPDFASLMCCAAGSQPEAFAAVIASHLSVCADCRAEVSRMQEIGVALFDALAPADVDAAAPVIAMRAGEAEVGSAVDESVTATAREAPAGDVPLPLVSVLGARLDDLPWRWSAPAIWTHPVPLSENAGGELLLIKVGPGKEMPAHGHDGQELTIILRGAYTDTIGRFGVGDVADLDSDTEHTPVACATEGCICLVARDGKLRFKGPVARLLQPLIGI